MGDLGIVFNVLTDKNCPTFPYYNKFYYEIKHIEIITILIEHWLKIYWHWPYIDFKFK